MSRSFDQHGLFPRLRGFLLSIPLKWRLAIRYLGDHGLYAIDVDLAKYSKGNTISDGDMTSIVEFIAPVCRIPG